MPIIVQTGPNHPGQVLYICRKESSGRRPQYELEGYQDRAERFEDVAGAANAIMQFSSLYGLVTKEV